MGGAGEAAHVQPDLGIDLVPCPSILPCCCPLFIFRGAGGAHVKFIEQVAIKPVQDIFVKLAGIAGFEPAIPASKAGALDRLAISQCGDPRRTRTGHYSRERAVS